MIIATRDHCALKGSVFDEANPGPTCLCINSTPARDPFYQHSLTHFPLGKMAAMSKTIFSYAFS